MMPTPSGPVGVGGVSPEALWLALPDTALVLATRRPAELQDFLRRLTFRVLRRKREILATAFALLGIYLIVKGVAELLP